MSSTIQRSGTILLLLAILSSCTKTKGFGPKSANEPAIPVIVQNAVDYRPDPTVTSSLVDSSIKIILSIPSNSGRTIKEITKVATSSSYAQIQSTGTTGFYTTAPIPASGSSVTFTTSIAAYYVNKPKTSTNPAPKVNTELTFRYYFLLTLDDGTIIVTEPVRVLVTS